jgi:phosphomevalonate kinase
VSAQGGVCMFFTIVASMCFVNNERQRDFSFVESMLWYCMEWFEKLMESKMCNKVHPIIMIFASSKSYTQRFILLYQHHGQLRKSIGQ